MTRWPEFLPVSSSGHLVIAEHLLQNWRGPGITFEVVLHLATLLAVVIFFRRDLVRLLRAIFPADNNKEQRHLLAMLILGTIPTGIIGICGKKFFTQAFSRLDLVGLMLLVTAFLLWFAERKQKNRASGHDINGLFAVIIGLVQGLAILPGISRSGSTIAVGILLGLTGRDAARFSFLLSIPAICGAALLNLKEISSINANDIPLYACGFMAALLTGLASLKLLMMIIEQKRLQFFACYCFVLGAGILLLTSFF